MWAAMQRTIDCLLMQFFREPVCMGSSIVREPQCAKAGRLLTDRLLGRIVFGHRFSSLTHLFLLLKQWFRQGIPVRYLDISVRSVRVRWR
jgi:hypothetical protein